MSILINNFAKGWQNKPAHHLVQQEALFYTQDVTLDIIGAFRCRQKHEPNDVFKDLDTSTAIENLFEVYVEGTEKRLMFYTIGTTLYCWNSATNTVRTLSTAMRGTHVSYAALKPILSDNTFIYYTDGKVLQCDNGTITRTWGIDPPDGAPDIRVGTVDGNLSTGAYSYVYTFYDFSTGSESDPSPAAAPLTVADDDSVIVSNIQTSSNTKVNARRLYRTLANGGTYYLVAQISDNATTEFTDTYEDGNLTTEWVQDQGVPVSGDVVAPYKTRLMLSGYTNFPNRVYFCRPDRPDNWPSTFFLDIGTTADKVVNMLEYEGRMYFIRATGISGLYGTDEDSFSDYTTKSHLGPYARWSAAVGPDGIYFLGYDGIYKFDGVKSTRISDQIDRIFGNTPGTWWDVVDRDTAPTACEGHFYLGKYYLRIPLRNTSGAVSNWVVEHDTFEQTWLLHNVDLDSTYPSVRRGKVYGSTDKYADSGKFMVYNLFAGDSSSVDDPIPVVVTKAFRMIEVEDYSTSKRGVNQQQSKPTEEIGYLRKWRVDAIGSWTFTFYVDDVSRYSTTLNALTPDDRNVWHDFPSEIKGREVYARIQGITNPGPTTHVFKELEMK